MWVGEVMARPIKSGEEKSTVISISISPSIKKYLDDNNLSPSKLFGELLLKYTSAPRDEKVNVESDKKQELRKEILKTLDELKILYLEKLKPEGDYSKKEKQFGLAVNFVVKKYSPFINKEDVLSYVERKSGYINLDGFEEEKQKEGVN
jgi:hypothetical protein